MKFNRPIYSIYPTIYCSGSVLINDVPVVDWYENEAREGGFIGDIVFNNVLLESGKYKIIGKIYTRQGINILTENEYLSIDFYLASADNWKESSHKFNPRIESPWHGMSENIKYPYFEIATEIEVEVPFVLDGW